MIRPIAAALFPLALALSAPALAETDVGVTAAVNQDAKGIVGSNVKTISLGDSVVFNQRIQTGGSGLVQVLLADGTTFMVGPNSDLVIDSFVYDPNAGTAQVTASLTKGVLRFIGGQTSKTEGGVTLNTPVGTMGIRGAMVDVVLDPPEGTPPHVDMLFGNEVTLAKGKELLGRLYAAGYSLALGANGAFEVLKTPPAWGSQIQAALAGRTGTKGGAPKGPTDGDVQDSDVAEHNSRTGPDKNKDGLSKKELDALLYAAAHYDELRNFILNNQHPYGFVGGVLHVDYGEGKDKAPLQNAFQYDEDVKEPIFAQFGFNARNEPVAVLAMLGYLGDTCTGLGGCLVYEGGTEGGELTYVPYDPEDSSYTVTAAGYILNHDDPSLDPDIFTAERAEAELDCTDCDAFIRWGFWGFSADDLMVGGTPGNVAFDAAWVNGDLTTRAQLDNLALNSESASASYSGDAIGIVHNGNNTYTATGDLSMNWNFAQRQGSIHIYDFDQENLDYGHGIDLGGHVISFDGETSFGGVIYGHHASGIVQGGFVNNGADVAAGVIGNFGFNKGSSYTASGVFMGERSLGIQ